jgi:carboxylesterase
LGVRAATVLLLHGFSNAPEDLEPLGARLAARGFVVKAPRLPGHGAGWRAIGSTSHQEWRRAAESALFAARHREEAERVAVVGHSLGALLALDLAARFPVAAVVALAPPVTPRTPLYPLTDVLAPLLWRLVPDGVGGFLAGMREVLRLRREVLGELAAVAAPLLVVQGGKDHLLTPAAAERLVAKTRGEPRRLIALPDAGHDLMVEAVLTAVPAFLEEVL